MFDEPSAAEAMKSGATPRTESAVAEPPERSREETYRHAAELLRKWRDDETGYDDEVWPLVEEDLPGLRMRCPE